MYNAECHSEKLRCEHASIVLLYCVWCARCSILVRVSWYLALGHCILLASRISTQKI